MSLNKSQIIRASPDFLKPSYRANNRQTLRYWIGNDSAVLNTQELWAIYTDSQCGVHILLHMYTQILRSKGGCYGAGVFSLPCNVIISNNIRLVSSNYIHFPPRESLINPYYNVTFARNLLQTWTHIHRAALYYTGWCTTHCNYIRHKLYSGDGQMLCRWWGMTAQLSLHCKPTAILHPVYTTTGPTGLQLARIVILRMER